MVAATISLFRVPMEWLACGGCTTAPNTHTSTADFVFSVQCVLHTRHERRPRIRHAEGARRKRSGQRGERGTMRQRQREGGHGSIRGGGGG